jgi:hypothetical protein
MLKWWFCPAIGPRPPICQNSHWITSFRARRSRRNKLAGLVAEVGAGSHRSRTDCIRFTAIRRRLVDDGRDAVVGRDPEEVGGELFTLADVDRQDAVFDAGLFQKHRELVAVGGGPVVKVDHGFSFL